LYHTRRSRFFVFVVVEVVVVVVVVVTDGSAASAAVIYLPRNRDTSCSGPGHRLFLLRVFVVVPLSKHLDII